MSSPCVSVNILALLNQTSGLLHLFVFSFYFLIQNVTIQQQWSGVRVTGSVSQGLARCLWHSRVQPLFQSGHMCCTQEPERGSREDVFPLLLVHPSATRAGRSTGALNYAWRLGCGWRLFHTTLWKWNDCPHHWEWACTCTWGSWRWIVGEVFIYLFIYFYVGLDLYKLIKLRLQHLIKQS